MKRCTVVILLLLFIYTLHAQVETIVYDGIIGITHDLENDSLVITEIAKNQPAGKAGLMTGDIIIEVDGKKISGAGLSRDERNRIMSGAGGTLMEILVKRPGVDSLLSISLLRDISLSIDPDCYYEYLVDSSDKWTIRDIVSDSVQALFSDVMDNNILVHTVQAGGTGEEIGF